jgi:hypothetical protein
VACNNATFGDPISNVRKWCETRPVNPTPRPGWTFCAWEDTQCSFSGSLEVSYGANGTFTAPRTFTGGVACSNAVFGDPLSGVRKWCETRPVPLVVPSNTAAPSISDSGTTTLSASVHVSQSLTASTGNWQGNPTSFAYQWSRCDTNGANCSPITNATNSTYIPVAADKGQRLLVTVIASNTAGTASANSLPTPTIKP